MYPAPDSMALIHKFYETWLHRELVLREIMDLPPSEQIGKGATIKN